MVAIITQNNENNIENGAAAKANRVPWYIRPPEEVYTIQRCLGTGHYGVVYAATHIETEKLYAIKEKIEFQIFVQANRQTVIFVLVSGLILAMATGIICHNLFEHSNFIFLPASPQSMDKAHPEYDDNEVRNEVAILERVCSHPNIATLYEVYEDAGHVYLVQEPCLGGELFDLVIERKHFTEGDAARAAAVLLSIIAHCHSCGVLHRDIKPENFLLKNIVPEDGRFDGSDVRSVDFGLSVFMNESSRLKDDIVGSSYYIAPEILAGEPYTAAADAWSLGVVVFILISGYPPFWGSSDAIIYERIQHQELDMDYQPWTDSVSSQAADFVRRLLTKDPTKRMTTAEAAQHPWLTQASTIPDEIPLAPSIIDRLRGFTRQNRLTCLLMTLVAHHLSDAAIGELRRTFYEMDTDHDGLIGVADITKALHQVGVDANGQRLNELLEQMDVSNTHAGQVNVDEFLAAALDRKKVFTRTTVAAVFKRLDTSGSGLLSMAALSTALAECGVPVAENSLRQMMQREGALEGAGVVSSRSFQNLLVTGAEVHQNRPAAAAVEPMLSSGLHSMNDNEDTDAWKNVLAPRGNLQRLSIASRKTNLNDERTPTSPGSAGGGGFNAAFGGSTGATLDDVLRQYSTSGYRTPRRRGSLTSTPKSRSPTMSPYAAAAREQGAPSSGGGGGDGRYYYPSQVSTPRSEVPSPSVACLGFD